MKNIHFVAALAAVVVTSTAHAAAPLKVGQTRTFGMENIDMIGTVNRMLNKQVGGEQMASGGTYKRLTADLSLICGYYTNVHDLSDASPIQGYAILIDKGNRTETTFAPINHVQQEAKGCWPGERARLAKWMKDFDKAVKASKP